ncbi:MAG TPA: sigma-54 dependent transcriptional regulator [Myxococcota bacterium]|nr:sigma-54 dependent transcriptional regulator [Myxococcota bacterium]
MSRGRILIVDDEANARTALANLLADDGYSTETAADGFKALPKLDEQNPDVVLTDLRMPGMDGLELIKRAKERDPDVEVVVMTAHGAVETAVAAMQLGAASYLTKPINVPELGIVIERAMERRRLRTETNQLRERLADRDSLDNIIGSSPSMKSLAELIRQVAPSRASVLVTGESGTGKELVAAALHRHSGRANGPFVKLNCAALAESVLESELFGHERGSFTGAMARRDGRFQQANGGTLFLDEIGEISQGLQVKLLRFLQEREFERVGGNETVSVDVRVIAATNRNLQEAIREGKFREDLYYRLNVVTIEMPPLRTREGDITLLAMHFLKRYGSLNGKPVHGFSDDALMALNEYRWPGNVRELENVIERAVVLAKRDSIELADLPTSVRTERTPGVGIRIPGSRLEEIERHAILRTLEHTGGSTSKAAEILGISPRKIQYKLQEYQTDGKATAEGASIRSDD